jgi:hypothetical protein
VVGGVTLKTEIVVIVVVLKQKQRRLKRKDEYSLVGIDISCRGDEGDVEVRTHVLTGRHLNARIIETTVEFFHCTN